MNVNVEQVMIERIAVAKATGDDAWLARIIRRLRMIEAHRTDSGVLRLLAYAGADG